MMNTLVLIEDDAEVREALRLSLEDEGYAVIEAPDGTAGLRLVQEAAPDLVLLDLRLPDISGFDVCRQLRARSLVPIIVVTAQDDTHDLVASLEAGADDFVTKPVVTKALAARIRALLRRAGYQEADPDGSRRFGDLDVREGEGIVLRDGSPLALTKTEFLLMCEFANHPNQVLNRDQLLERVWGYEYLGDGRLVDAHIRRLRQKIEADPDRPTRLVTVRGLGYRFLGT
jgi:DNA-binding response OmpR family regulator